MQCSAQSNSIFISSEKRNSGCIFASLSDYGNVVLDEALSLMLKDFTFAQPPHYASSIPVQELIDHTYSYIDWTMVKSVAVERVV